MFIKTLGVLDFLAAIVVIFETNAPAFLASIFATYLLLKGVIFLKSGDFISGVDVLIGIYLIFISFGFSVLWLTMLSSLFLLQKAVLSLFA